MPFKLIYLNLIFVKMRTLELYLMQSEILLQNQQNWILIKLALVAKQQTSQENNKLSVAD